MRWRIRMCVVSLSLSSGGCGIIAAAGYSNRLPLDGSGGYAIRFATVGEEPMRGRGPSPAMLIDVDVGDFGFREATYLGMAHGFGDGPFGFVRGGVSLLSIGHERSDPDPDPWVGVSATLQGGVWLPIDDIVLELGVGAVAETGWTGAGAGVYMAVWLGLGGIWSPNLDIITR